MCAPARRACPTCTDSSLLAAQGAACQKGPTAAQLEAQRLAEEIDKKNREDWERQQQKIKLLLLGAEPPLWGCS